MDTIGALSAVNGATSTGVGGFNTLSSEDFTRLIFTELSKQDPLQPNDTNALLQQISQIRSIQSDMDLVGNLTSLVSQNEFASAATLIGQRVTGLTDENRRVAGTVRSVSRTNDGAVVELDGGERVRVSRMDAVLAPEVAP